MASHTIEQICEVWLSWSNTNIFLLPVKAQFAYYRFSDKFLSKTNFRNVLDLYEGIVSLWSLLAFTNSWEICDNIIKVICLKYNTRSKEVLIDVLLRNMETYDNDGKTENPTSFPQAPPSYESIEYASSSAGSILLM